MLVWWVLWLPIRLLFSGVRSTGRAVGIFGGRGDDGVVIGDVRTGQGGSDGASLPTVDVGQKTKDAEPVGGPGSVAEEVGQIIDGGDGKMTREEGGEGGNEPNPKKRMWEEPVEAAEAVREKDEL